MRIASHAVCLYSFVGPGTLSSHLLLLLLLYLTPWPLIRSEYDTMDLEMLREVVPMLRQQLEKSMFDRNYVQLERVSYSSLVVTADNSSITVR